MVWKYILFSLGIGVLSIFLFEYFFQKDVEKTTIDSLDLFFKPKNTIGPYPSKIINLSNWKITLPIGTEKKPKYPLEIRQPELNEYRLDPWFSLTPEKDGVVFRAPVNAPTTGNTKYARSELREMKDGGKNSASWSSTEGKHTMILDQAVTAIPKVKQHVVAGQIHDSEDDVIVIRLEYPNLYVNVDGENEYVLDANYTLGKRFTVKFVAEKGKTSIYYNKQDDPVYVLDLDYSEAYFKAGVYTQSNCKTEEDKKYCQSDNYGEVILYNVEVIHI
ncbi:MAG: polysaccharide lyase family 7 protein [Candidatus Moraniibacteriota bacterium]|nr:MAG: polysaccharide lyase family 7 protein [Candidatus Moranbacteria bacterium]